jgi:hypothetical protein
MVSLVGFLPLLRAGMQHEAQGWMRLTDPYRTEQGAHDVREGARDVSERMETSIERDWGSQETYGDAWSPSYGGVHSASGVRSDSIGTAFARETHTRRVIDASVVGSEQRMEDITRDIVRERETERGIQRN